VTILLSVCSDLSLWVNAGMTLFTLTGFCLFAWWWKHNRHASNIYAFITFLFLAEFVAQAIHLYARFALHCSPEMFTLIINSWMWHVRLVPLLVVHVLIIAHVLRRILKARQGVTMTRTTYLSEDFKEEIMIVEDEESVRGLVVWALGLKFPNVKIHSVSTMDQAVLILKKHTNIALVLTDIRLPGRSGFELCEFIKKERPWVFVMGMTGYEGQYELWEARNIGFDDYFLKPFRLGDLINSVTNALEKMQRWATAQSNDPCRAHASFNKDHVPDASDMNTLVGLKHRDADAADKDDCP